MPRLRLPHFVIVMSLGLLLMHYKVSELAETLCVPHRALRDWFVTGITHFRDQRKLREGEAYCVRCKKSVVLNDISTHPRHGRLIMVSGKRPTWAAWYYNEEVIHH
jgi:hypothetical protein